MKERRTQKSKRDRGYTTVNAKDVGFTKKKSSALAKQYRVNGHSKPTKHHNWYDDEYDY